MNYTSEINPFCKHDWVGDDDCVYCGNEDLEYEIVKLKAQLDEMESAACDLVESVYEKDAEIEKFHEFLHNYDLWVRGDICRRTLTEEREKLR